MALFIGTPAADTLNGSAAADLVLGRGGADALVGGTGADTLFGGGGDDVITGQRNVPLDFTMDGNLILGGAGRNSIDGNGGGDTILGGAGDDTIRGALGADVIAGGPGHDRFVFQRINDASIDSPPGEGARDVILDFRHGADVIDLGFYLSPGFVFPKLEPVFLGTAPFQASQALQVRYDIEGDRTIVQFYSVLGTALPTADIAGATGEIELVGRHHLTAADFLLT